MGYSHLLENNHVGVGSEQQRIAGDVLFEHDQSLLLPPFQQNGREETSMIIELEPIIPTTPAAVTAGTELAQQQFRPIELDGKF